MGHRSAGAWKAPLSCSTTPTGGWPLARASCSIAVTRSSAAAWRPDRVRARKSLSPAGPYLLGRGHSEGAWSAVSPGGELTCERDRTSTRLTCVQCAVPICPQCLVRTPVGLKCPTCGSERTRGGHGLSRGVSWAVPVVVAVVLLAVFGLPRLFSSKTTSNSSSTANPLAETVPPTVGVAGPELRVRYARIGQESRDGDLAFTVTAMDCGATHLPGAAAARVAQGLFCFVSVDVKNFGR